uniref:Tspb protein n=1 Tax=Dulem virus 65 TaxID=3145776 RepID=A0AAU8BAX3_9VIRU
MINYYFNNKKILLIIFKLYLILILSIYPTMIFANTANPAVGGWTWGAGARSGATSSYSGKFTDTAGKVWNGVAKIKPSGKDIGKFLGKFGAAAVVTTALDIVLDGVDYVMDPVNNRIKYKVTGCTMSYHNKVFSGSLEKVANSYCKSIGHYSEKPIFKSEGNNLYRATCDGGYGGNGIVDCNPREIALPLDVVGDMLIDEAEDGNVKVGALVGEVADTMTGEIVGQFEDTKAPAVPDVLPETGDKTGEAVGDKTGEATGEKTGTDTQNPSKDADLPEFCGWAPIVCEMSKKVIDLYDKFIKWMQEIAKDIADFFKIEDKPTDVNIENEQIETVDTNINFSKQCPSNLTLAEVKLANVSERWEIDFTKYCEILTTFIRPILIAMSSFVAVLIISGVKTND